MRRLFLFAVVLFFALPAYAQFSIPGADGAVSISMTPAFPGPHTAVELTLQSALYDVSQGTVTWTVDGKIVAQGIGETTAHLVTGALGAASNVQVQVSTADGDASTAVSIVPTSVDLLWESNSYTPPFYKGRALPSSGSTVTVVAVPHLIRGGISVPADQLTYTWKKDGAVIAAVSGRGKSSATFDSPLLYGTDSLSVLVSTGDGSLAASGIVRIPDSSPQLLLYEDNPLFGVLYHSALGSARIPETEMSFIAVPLFSPVRVSNDAQLAYDWQVNGSPVALNAAKPNEITINAEKSSGIANIALELTHATNYFFDAKGSWNITFSNSAGGFEGAGASDPFHQ